MGALRKKQQEDERLTFYKTSTERLTNMQKQLNDISFMYKQQAERRAARRAAMGPATVGQQMGAGPGSGGGTGLRISRGGMSPSARRRMYRSG